MLSLLSAHWLDQHHADAEVVLCLQLSSCSSDDEPTAVVARIPAHCVVLSSASSYFATLLGPAWQRSTPLGTPAPARLVLGEPADVAAVVALLKCMYTGAVDVTAADLECILQQPSCSCRADVMDCFASSHAQQLQLRVVQMADTYHVQGVMDVVAAKLTNLFAHQLEWPTIEAVLWMPPTLSEQPRLVALRQLAVNAVKQRLGVLDAALGQPSGRHMLQSLPPFALAAILSCDTLEVTSENSVLAAVEVWLAGPVAAALVHQADVAPDGVQLPASAHGCFGNSSSSRHCGGSKSGGVPVCVTTSTEHPLLAALRMLVGSVRLNKCTGAFLAAAVARMPWLCRVLHHKAGDLELLKQYHSSDIEGRYQLSMHLIQQTISCPWQSKLRKALPASTGGYSSTAAGSSSGSIKPGQLDTCTLLSEVRSLLDAPLRQQGARTALPGIQLAELVQGGYCWRLFLAAAPLGHTGADADTPSKADTTPAAAAGQAGTAGEQQQQQSQPKGWQQMVLRIDCRPAWVSNLSSFGSSSQASTATASSSAAAAPVPPAVLGAADLARRCDVCQCLCSIAVHKAAAARARHLGAAAAASGGTMHNDSSSSSGSGSQWPACWAAAQDVVVGVNVVAAPSAALLRELVAANTARAPAEAFVACRLCWSDAAGAALGLVPLNVTGIDSGSNNLVASGWDCSGCVGASLAPGYQPELWSRLAYTGELHWHCSLRLLTD